MASSDGKPVNRPHRLHGAYVLAWLWVDLPRGHDTYTDEQIIQIAHDTFHREGELEIDTSYTGLPTARVSRNDDDWCDDPECGEGEDAL